MRVRICHRIVREIQPPARQATQVLRLTPRSHEGQRVGSWRIDLDVDCRLRASEDAFGNIVHSFSAPGPVGRISISVDGDVETFDVAGLARGSSERFPPELYLRPTPLSLDDDALRAISAEISVQAAEPIERLHLLMAAIRARLAFEPGATDAATTAAQALSLGRGVGRDFAHAFIACARAMNIPARFVSGYFLAEDGPREPDAAHAWAEAHVENLGWIGFDAVHDICPRESHVSLARGLDYLGAAPVRGARSGGESERLTTTLSVSRLDGPPRG